jgi:hypothetical protein
VSEGICPATPHKVSEGGRARSPTGVLPFGCREDPSQRSVGWRLGTSFCIGASRDQHQDKCVSDHTYPTPGIWRVRLTALILAPLLSARVDDIAEDLRRYGEDDTAVWVLSCSDDELVRVCSVADWLLYHGRSSPSGGSMMIAKACALAAVYVREGSPRDLRRSRRGPAWGAPTPPSGGRRPGYRRDASWETLRSITRRTRSSPSRPGSVS